MGPYDPYDDGPDGHPRAVAARRARFLAERNLTRELPDESEIYDFLSQAAERPVPILGARPHRRRTR